ncbi:RHS repeat protein [Candidatus Woesearchaeota archaeon]|nr:RHS repeat protein [Candidatus Woesearchaeota archaeon]
MQALSLLICYLHHHTHLTEISNDAIPANKTKYNYDALSRITSIINPDGTTKNTIYRRQK